MTINLRRISHTWYTLSVVLSRLVSRWNSLMMMMMMMMMLHMIRSMGSYVDTDFAAKPWEINRYKVRTTWWDVSCFNNLNFGINESTWTMNNPPPTIVGRPCVLPLCLFAIQILISKTADNLPPRQKYISGCSCSGTKKNWLTHFAHPSPNFYSGGEGESTKFVFNFRPQSPFRYSGYTNQSINQYRKCLHGDVASTVQIITVGLGPNKIHNSKQLLG